jgi:hypothetical protein
LHLFSDDEDMTKAMHRDIFTMSEFTQAVNDMAPRLNAICGELLDAHIAESCVLDHFADEEGDISAADVIAGSTVKTAHRPISEYLSSEKVYNSLLTQAALPYCQPG